MIRTTRIQKIYTPSIYGVKRWVLWHWCDKYESLFDLSPDELIIFVLLVKGAS